MLGVGLGYRREIESEILKFEGEIDWLEFYPDHYIERESDFYEIVQLKNKFPLCPHSLNLSIGSPNHINMSYLNKIKNFSEQINAPWASDHLCFTNSEGIELGHLTPVERTDETISDIVRNIKSVKDTLNREFLVENITYDFELPTNQYSETEFINRVIEESDCGLLLDLTNVFINSQNHGFSPYDYLDKLDLQRVVEVHLAGGVNIEGKWYDTHSERVNKEVWDLLEYLLQRGEIKGILLELDSKFPKDFQVVIDELNLAKKLLNKY